MFLFCEVLFLTAKFHDHPYMTVSESIRKMVKNSITTLESKDKLSSQDSSLLQILVTMIDVMDETSSSIRTNLIRFRNDIEIWRGDDNLSPQRRKILEFTVEAVQILHYGTFICSNFEKIYKRYDLFKQTLKEFRETNKSNLNKVDLAYLSHLYKIPQLIIFKRGFEDKLNQVKANKHLKEEPVNDTK
jgi:hypothetical protein